MKNNIILFDNDLIKYPPIISIINILLCNSNNVTFIGYCSSEELIKQLVNSGLIYKERHVDKTFSNKIKKLYIMIQYKRYVKSYLYKNFRPTDCILWIFGNENIWILNNLVNKYKTILYLFEFPHLKILPQYRILNPFLDYKTLMQKGWKVVCAEYNRAQITKSFFSLNKTPHIIPNKPYLWEEVEINTEFQQKYSGKKIILYQGIFNYPERNLDAFCEAVNYLPEDFILIIMGPNDQNKENLRLKYQSEKIIFLPFQRPPLHLEYTRAAYIGILSYFPSNTQNISSIINVLYCAPNKIFEYSKYGIPMVSNDVPSLKNTFEKFKAGICTNSFEGKEVAQNILKIDSNYQEYKSGAFKLYNSENIENKVLSLIE